MNRATSSAAWIGAVTAVLALLVSIGDLAYRVSTDRQASQEHVVLKAARVFDDYPSELRDFAQTGTIGVYWNIVVSNNGQQDVSLDSYDLLDVGNASGVVSYTDMDQGLWSPSLERLDLPVSIPAGHSMKMFLRTGLMMDAQAYRLAKEAFPQGKVDSINHLTEVLNADGIDFYGNKVESSAAGVYSVQPEGRQEQVFGITFSTTRGTAMSDMMSWYTYSGLGR